MKISAIFSAAGSSTRMGKANKLLLHFGNATLIEHTFKQLKKSTIDEIVVVTGFDNDQIKKTLSKEKVIFKYNPNHITGLTSSIQTGIKSLSNECDGYMITLSDMPYLTKDDYNMVLKTFRSFYKEDPIIVVPQINERMGNPVIFSKEFKDEVLKHQKPEGCKDIILKNDKFVKKISLNNSNAFKDIDRPEDYKKLIKCTS